MEYFNRSKKDNDIMRQNNIHGLIENIYSLDYSELNKPEEEIDIRILELCNKPNKILFINKNNGKSIIKEYLKKLDEKKYKNNKDDNKNNDISELYKYKQNRNLNHHNENQHKKLIPNTNTITNNLASSKFQNKQMIEYNSNKNDYNPENSSDNIFLNIGMKVAEQKNEHKEKNANVNNNKINEKPEYELYNEEFEFLQNKKENQDQSEISTEHQSNHFKTLFKCPYIHQNMKIARKYHFLTKCFICDFSV